MTNKKINAIIMAILIILTPLAYADIDTSEEFELTAQVPTITKTNKITITGTTKPNTEIKITLNKAVISETQSNSNGEFEIKEIILLHENNELSIRAKDSNGNIRVLNYNVKMDKTPPKVTYDEIPKGATTRTLQIKGTSTEPVTIQYRTSNTTIFKNVNVNKTFTIPIELEDGLNKIELIAKDSAGNTDTQKFETTYDISSPQFQNTNLHKLEPCYFDWPLGISKKIDLTGQLNEKSTIYVYVNHESTPSKIRTTDDTGYFRIKDVELTTKVKSQTTATSTTFEIGESYANHIKITAKDLAGNQASIEKTITCSTCGGGASGFTINTQESLKSIIPTQLMPKLLMQGQEIITIPFNISYTGINTARIGSIRVSTAQIAPEYADDYDNDKITAVPITQISQDRQSATGLIQIKVNQFDPLGAVEPDASNFRKEYNISKHRFAKCSLQPGLGKDLNYGCMRFFLMMEINYNENIAPTIMLDPNLQQTTSPTIQQKTQKICIAPIEIAIDRIAEDFSPPKLTEKIRKNIDFTIKKIEPIKEYLDTISEYTMYSCIFAVGTVTALTLAEATTCKIGELISLTGDAPWQTEIAETGLCDEIYSPEYDKKDDQGIEGNERARKACNSCRSVTALRKWMQYEAMNRICDRIACPSAKTFKKYIQEKSRTAQDITETITGYLDKIQVEGKISTAEKLAELKEKYGVNGKFYSGNDCGFGQDLIKPEYGQETGIEPYGIKALYEFAQTASNRNYCIQYGANEPRTAIPECCGIEYEREWGTACGAGKIYNTNIGMKILGIPIGLDTFDELQESTCLAARQAGQPDDTLSDGTTCGGLNAWNSIAGFCEPNTGEARSEPIYTGMYYDQIKKDSEDNKVYFFIEPKTNTKDEIINYKVYRGYIIKRAKYKSNSQDYTGARELTQSLYEVHDSEDLSKYFKGEKSTQEQKKAFINKIKSYNDIGGYTTDKAETTFNRIKSSIGEPDKEYIVQPDSGLLRAIQCICLPAIRAWIDEWTNILTLFRDCIATVEIGKGDAGICDDFISQAICDRIYDLLKCFTSKIGSPGTGFRISKGAGIGNIIGILTNTASQMSNTLESRYGKTGIWNSLFNEKQLVHGICMWAFTGKWDLEISQIIQNTIQETPIESQPLIGECKRYFRGYNPNTNPTGLANWVYECGVSIIAGADINYQIRIQCSDDLRCKTQDGFRNNECDCVQKGKKYFILEQGTLNRGDILNKKIIKTIQAGANSAVRYDTAMIYYEWLDPKTNQKRSNTETMPKRYIRQAEAPLGFCAFDPFTLAFRCQFGKQESGIKINKINPYYQYQHKDKQTQAFVAEMPETFQFKFTVRQIMPEETTKQKTAKKYLFYTLKNHVNNIVSEAVPGIDPAIAVFETNGDYTKTIKLFSDDSIKEKLLKKLDETTQSKLTAWISKPNKAAKQADGKTYLPEHTATRKTIDSDKKTSTSSVPVIAEITEDTITFYTIQSKGYTTATKGTKITEITNIKKGQYTAKGEVKNSEYTIQFIIEEIPASDETITIYLPEEKTDIKSPYKTGNPADWTVEFTLYDANEYGESTDQITVSPDGIEQKQTQIFKVITNEYAKSIGAEEEKGIETTPVKQKGETDEISEESIAEYEPIEKNMIKILRDMADFSKTEKDIKREISIIELYNQMKAEQERTRENISIEIAREIIKAIKEVEQEINKQTIQEAKALAQKLKDITKPKTIPIADDKGLVITLIDQYQKTIETETRTIIITYQDLDETGNNPNQEIDQYDTLIIQIKDKTNNQETTFKDYRLNGYENPENDKYLGTADSPYVKGNVRIGDEFELYDATQEQRTQINLNYYNAIQETKTAIQQESEPVKFPEKIIITDKTTPEIPKTDMDVPEDISKEINEFINIVKEKGVKGEQKIIDRTLGRLSQEVTRLELKKQDLTFTVIYSETNQPYLNINIKKDASNFIEIQDNGMNNLGGFLDTKKSTYKTDSVTAISTEPDTFKYSWTGKLISINAPSSLKQKQQAQKLYLQAIKEMTEELKK